ncbi:hypothetical protein [Cyclobacterium amurskyense]|uniref:Transmembrane protein n=1 Tax=Cyclobacterium amurskyense TaxID=320787 RepID=A0A0H4PAT1_9BACT|nr:hypothetical protein [Cyclobacterium amurskyense]AKP51541.1 hypothetical protein CA2015_2119 [Cyclobacterium amurskyense]
MEFNLENLKGRAQQLKEERRPKSISSERLGSLLLDTINEIEIVYKKVNRRTFIFSFSSIIISFFSLIFSILKSDDITVNGANLLGVMVGVLTFLVTLLIGFQIYKAIEVEDAIDKKISSVENRIFEFLKTHVDIKIEEKLNEGKK